MFGLGLGLGLSGRSGYSDREPLGSGNCDQKPRNYQYCYYQDLWVRIRVKVAGVEIPTKNLGITNINLLTYALIIKRAVK